MGGFEGNKVIGAIILAMLIAMVAGFVSREAIHVEKQEKIAFPVADLKVPETSVVTTAVAVAEPIEGLLAAADPAAGQKVARACTTCHTFEKGGVNKVGPHLWDIVGRTVAEVTDFAYSDGMKTHHDRKWTYDELNHYLFNPKAHVPGTKMAFAGVKNTQERANLIAWLRTLADNPAALPQ